MNTGRDPMGPQTRSLLFPWIFILNTRWATALVSVFVLSSAYCSEGSATIYHCSCALKKTFSLIQNKDHLHIFTQHFFPWKIMKCLWDWDFTCISAKTKNASTSVYNWFLCVFRTKFSGRKAQATRHSTVLEHPCWTDLIQTMESWKLLKGGSPSVVSAHRSEVAWYSHVAT